MYDELVKDLRDSNCATKGMCGMCPKEDLPCIYRFASEAADAIEQLSTDLERSNDYETFWKEEAEEALRRFQLVVADKPHADYSDIWTTDSGAAYNADLSKCDKTRYEYVTHWMPLPEPPKEV